MAAALCAVLFSCSPPLHCHSVDDGERLLMAESGHRNSLVSRLNLITCKGLNDLPLITSSTSFIQSFPPF